MHHDKKLALCVAAALAVPAAHADVTIYGFVAGGIESARATGNGNAAKEYKTTTRVVDENSRIGFMGNEDLGNGLKAIWQVESSLRNFEQGGTTDKAASATFATRNTFVGLQSADWGTAQLGLYDSAYKRLTDVGLNILANTVADNAPSTSGGSVYSRRSARLANSVHYTSPVWQGLQFGVSYGVDEARPTATDGTRQNDYRASVALGYRAGGLALGLGYDREGDKLNDAASADAQKRVDGMKLAASYTFAATGTLVGAGFERVAIDNNGSPNTRQNDWLIALSQPVGKGLTLKAGYEVLGRLEGAAGDPNDYKARQWMLGATYDLSKRTQLFAYGTRINNAALQKANFSVNPVYSTGLGTTGAKLDAGNDPQAFGVGFRTAF